jgi:CrcB protein
VTALLVALGAAVGATARYAVGRALPGRRATLLVNVLGSLLLGAVIARSAPGGSVAALVGTGFCGAFTTFSSYALQCTPGSAEGEGGTGTRVGYAVLTLALCVTAAAVGLAL